MLVLNVYFQILIRRLQVGTEGFKGVLLLTLMIVSLMVPAIATTTVSEKKDNLHFSLGIAIFGSDDGG